MNQRNAISSIVMLIVLSACGSCSQPEEEQMMTVQQATTVNLIDYLADMAEKLDCFFTIEDAPDSEGVLPWIARMTIVPNAEIDSIDDLVSKLNQDLEGVDVIRSQRFPSVVHLIAEDLRVAGYVMDENVDVQYSGNIGEVPYHLGTLLQGRIGIPSGGGIPGPEMLADATTEVEIDEDDEIVRNVLTAAVPLASYSRFPWQSSPDEVNGVAHVAVIFNGKRVEEPDE